MQQTSPIAFHRLRFPQDAAHSGTLDTPARLARLGISHIIVSPAEPGQTVWTDPSFPALAALARKAGLAICVDFPGDTPELESALRAQLSDGSIAGLRIPAPDALADPIGTIRALAGLLAPSNALLIVAGALAERPDIRRLPGVIHDAPASEAVIGRLLLDLAGLTTLERLWTETGGESFRTLLAEARRAVLLEEEAAIDPVLAGLHAAIGPGAPRDVVRAAFETLVLAAPDAPIHLVPGETPAHERVAIERMIAPARVARPELGQAVFDRLRTILSGDEPKAMRAALEALRLVRTVQHGAQTRAIRRQHRLIGLESATGDPVAALTRGRFHDLMRRQQRDHGRKRLTGGIPPAFGEKGMDRLIGLADLAAEWAGTVTYCERLARPLASYAAGHPTPAAGQRLLLYQLMTAIWPVGDSDDALPGEVAEMFVQALRQSGLRQEDDIASCALFAERLLAAPDLNLRFGGFARRVALVGALTGLARLLLKSTVPGIPAFSEDPGIDGESPAGWAALAADWPSGRLHAALAGRLLALRRTMPHLLEGGYEPLPLRGGTGRVVAFARRSGGESLVVVTPTRFGALTGRGTAWPSRIGGSIDLKGQATNLLSGALLELGGPTDLARLLDPLPLALIHLS